MSAHPLKTAPVTHWRLREPGGEFRDLFVRNVHFYSPCNRESYHGLFFIPRIYLKSAEFHRLFSFAPIVKVFKLPFKGVHLVDLSQ